MKQLLECTELLIPYPTILAAVENQLMFTWALTFLSISLPSQAKLIFEKLSIQALGALQWSAKVNLHLLNLSEFLHCYNSFLHHNKKKH